MLEQWCRELSRFPEAVWIAYAKSRDPLSRRISTEEYTEHFRAAHACGVEMARQVRETWGDVPCQEIAEKLGIRVETAPMPDGDGMLTFAMFHEPDRIQVFTDNAAATESLIRECGGQEYLGDVDICQMLLAHELFHALQLRHPELYVNQKHIRLWKIGPFVRNSALLSLEEVAAMAFAQTLLDLRCTPYVYDVLMLLPQATMEAKALYERLQILNEEVSAHG